MSIRKLIREQVEKIVLKENQDSLIDSLLDKINRDGMQSLTQDEKRYLETKEKELGDWIESDDENTYDLEGNKLAFDEFDFDEDLFYNESKLKRVLKKHLGDVKTQGKNADWYGIAYSLGNGYFIHLGDDELDLVKRNVDLETEGVEDEVVFSARNGKEFYNLLKKAKEIK